MSFTHKVLVEQNEISFAQYFSIQKEKLCDLFDTHNIHEKVSHQSLQQLGGIEGLLKTLRVSRLDGLSEQNKEDMQTRQQYFGSNVLPPKKQRTLIDMIFECFQDTMLQILVVASIVSTVIGILEDGIQTGWMEGASILLAVVIIVSISAGNNYAKEKQFQKLNAKREELFLSVTRDRQVRQLDAKQLLVGDILHIQIGDILNIDGLMIEGSEIMMDESSITGESDYISKASPSSNPNGDGFIISGSKVMDGSGLVVVLAVGMDTQLGKLRAAIEEVEENPTPLQLKLESIANDIGKVGVIAAGLTMLALFIHLAIEIIFHGHCFLCFETVNALIEAFLTSVTIIVVAVPEGLPLAVTISLAFSVNKMKDENNLVKHLQCCEIMGNATNICSDKTGTLTQNIMSVDQMYMNDTDQPRDRIDIQAYPKSITEMFGVAVCVNSGAFPIKNKQTNLFEQVGNKTECALLEIADRFGYSYENYRPSDKILKILPFNSARKKMTTIYQIDQNRVRCFLKGASEVILEQCVYYQMQDGPVPLDHAKKEFIKKEIILRYADKALRTLAIAYKDVQFDGNLDSLGDDIEQECTLIAIAGIKDPIRPEIPAAVEQCKTAGVRVRMVTGDNKNTAVAIAKECGIIENNLKDALKSQKSIGQSSRYHNYEVMEGTQFRNITGGLVYDNPNAKNPRDKGEAKIKNFEEFKKVAEDLKVLARSSPEDKYVLVTGLIQLGEVVAVTGDGTNDAPALKKANVGFAMGITGTEVSKDAAGIILLDDNFKSIVTACKWGRNIYDSIRKFIQFQLTVNVVALFMSFLGAVVLKQSPLNSIEMLWVNIIMDTFASLALSTEPPTDELLKRKPYKKEEPIVTPNMWRNVFGQSVFQICMLTFLLFKAPEVLGIESSIGMIKYEPEKARHFTIFFQSFVLMQVFNEFNARKLLREQVNIFEGLFNNSLFWLVIITTFLVQFLIIQFGGPYVQVTALTLNQHLFCLAIGSGGLIVGVIIKILPNALFNKIKIFKEELELNQLEGTISSRVRRNSSARFHLQSSQMLNQKCQNATKK